MKHRFLPVALALTALCAFTFSCASPQKTSGTVSAQKTSGTAAPKQTTAPVRGESDFSFRIWKEVDKRTEGAYILSPLSLRLMLGMVLDGARGETADEIAAALGFAVRHDEAVPAMDAWARRTLHQLPALDKQTRLTMGDALFVNQRYPLLETYRRHVGTIYDATVENRDFSRTKETLSAINGWCKRQTNGLIPKVLDTLYPDMMAVVMNAVYFKGVWTDPFRKELTKEETFTRENGTRTQLPMMKTQKSFAYAENEQLQAVRLPYGNESFAMTVLLPKAGHTVAEVLESLDEQQWNSLKDAMRYEEISLSLPKFESKFHIELNDCLRAMGMEKAFTGSADFGKMFSSGACISTILQDALIKVDEEGTEAAAVTTGLMKATAFMPRTPIPFHADHPFLYLISANGEDTLLFAGKYDGASSGDGDQAK